MTQDKNLPPDRQGMFDPALVEEEIEEGVELEDDCLECLGE
jgi:hypothetical protein